MVFGTTTFKCDNCGNKFIALAAGWCATCFIPPCLVQDAEVGIHTQQD